MGFVVLFHLVQRLCSDVAAELCGVPRQCRWEGPELPPVPVGTYPLTPADRGPVHLLYIVDVPLGLILLTSVAVLWAISFCCHFFFSQSKNHKLRSPCTQQGVPRRRLVLG